MALPPLLGKEIQSLPYFVQEWLRQVRNAITGATSGAIPWASVDKAGSNLTEIVTRNHNNLQNISGGAVNDLYHLKQTEHDLLVAYSNVELTGQTLSLGPTTIVTPGTDGEYEVGIYHVCTTAGGAGTLDTTVGWTDDAAARTVKPAAQISLTGTNFTQGFSMLRAKTTAPITYTTTVAGAAGSPIYAVFINLRRLS